jgi:predicted Zn finger-like uncharacterized protein
MTFTVSCPSCGTSFPVDPAKVPERGVRAQCSMCPEIFDVDVPGEATAIRESSLGVADPPEPGAVDLPELEASFESSEFTEDDPAAEFGALEPTAEFVPPGVEEPEPVAVVEEPAAAAAEAPPESPGPIRFGRRSPEDKAKSLARSLVSDLIAYNPAKHKEALAAGTLQEVFGEEIEKSLKEYQEQVEPDVMAKGTIFNDALNSILAEGQSVFSLDT